MVPLSLIFASVYDGLLFGSFMECRNFRVSAVFCVPVSPPDLRTSIVNEASAMENMFVALVFGLYEEHENTPSGSLVFTVCTCSTFTASALVFGGQS